MEQFKKGFTLIELLAVIIILAVIALIATPIILNVVDKVKESARKSSVAGYADAVNLAYVETILTDEKIGPVLSENWLSKKVITSGNKVNCDIVIRDNNNATKLYNCNVNGEGQYNFINGKVCIVGEENCKFDETYQLKGNILYSKGRGSLIYPDTTVPEIKIYKGSTLIKTVNADVDGNYLIADIPFGKYDILFTMTDHTSHMYKDYAITENNENLNAYLYKGDINGDGISDQKDNDLFSKNYASIPLDQRIKYDINGDGNLNLNDLNLVPTKKVNMIDLGYKVSVKGKVTNGSIPISDAKITFYHNYESYTVTTDEQGNYELKNIPAGTYAFYVYITGYTSYLNIQKIEIFEDETIDYNAYLTTHRIYNVITEKVIQRVKDAIAANTYNAILDSNKDMIIDQNDLNYFENNKGKVNYLIRSSIKNQEMKNITIRTNQPNTVISLEGSAKNVYFVTTDNNGLANIVLPDDIYQIYSYKRYYINRDTTINTKESSEILVTQIYGDVSDNGKIDSTDCSAVDEAYYNGTGDLLYDIDQDGVLTEADVELIYSLAE